MKTSQLAAALVLLGAPLVGCYGGNDIDAEPGVAEEQGEFWNALQAHCGKAYAGRIDDATPEYREQLGGTEMVMHFRMCADTIMHMPLHVNDDRSRTLILSKAHNTLRLKHDHRLEDGSDDEVTQYGGDAPRPGLPERQIFVADSYTAHILPERFDNFWFLHLIDDTTLHYGVHWPKYGRSIRLEFDLTQQLPEPPTPWGY
jgi:hypothetical protein